MSITIVIPLYNSSQDVHRIIDTLYPLETDCELLLINDGSDDDTAEICQTLANKYHEIRFIDKPHTGVSDTRNVGIKEAKGKYILFLDADDCLKRGSCKALADFFDRCDDDIDLVTYPIETHYHNSILAPHFRYQTLNRSGIYDLNLYPYIGQTTMNIVVRNKFEHNVLFDTMMTFSEDQKYCCDVLKESRKMGFCKEAKYIYNRSENSSSGKLNGACYIFEQAMKMFEDIFRDYETVPAAFQGLYINDLAWKLRANILYPYHYDEKSFAFALDRIKALLARVDSSVILNHPDINYFHKFYWLSLKPNASVKAFFTEKAFGLELDGSKIYQKHKFEIVVIRIRIDNGIFVFRGFIKSPVFGFCEKPELYAVINGENIKQELFLSAHSYYFCHTQTNVFYGFCVEVSEDRLQSLRFKVKAGNFYYECVYTFMPKSPFSHALKRYNSVIGSRHLHYNTNKGEFSFGDELPVNILRENSRMLPAHSLSVRKKALALKTKQRIYLYYDCRGVEKDNGCYKFMEDWNKNDGIVRKYICDPQNRNLHKLFTKKQRKDVIEFGSHQHKIYFLAAEKIFTAYIEDINVIPFPANEFDLYSDFFSFEVVYLQHGVLHGSLPWKYTPEVIFADKVCISTTYEQKLFTEKYHFRKEDLLTETMPRLRRLDRTSMPERKILYAPSWRQYLIGPDVDGIWKPLPDVFLHSDYYKKISELLNSKDLEELLELNNYTLEFKLHPIFSAYETLFDIQNERVKIVRATEKIENYAMLITDFSSFAFDFLYLGRKVFSFIPDEMQFRCGMNSYREIEPESERMFIKIKDIEDLKRMFKGTSENVVYDLFQF